MRGRGPAAVQSAGRDTAGALGGGETRDSVWVAQSSRPKCEVVAGAGVVTRHRKVGTQPGGEGGAVAGGEGGAVAGGTGVDQDNRAEVVTNTQQQR